MKKTLASLCFFSLAASLAAFDLPAVNTAALRGSQATVPVAPAARALEDDMPHGAIPQDAPGWHELRAAFFRAEKPAELYSLMGVYKGHLHPLYEREDYTVPFVMAVYRDALTGAVKAVFPMPPNGSPETVALKLTGAGAEFADAWGGRARVVIRRDGNRLYLFTNLYSDETYGVCEPAGALPFPGGDEIRGRGLEEDMIHGGIPSGAPAAVKPASLYAGLAADFARSGAAAAADLQGWRAGRVYAKDSPDYPFGLLLAGRLTGGEFLLSVMAQGVQPAFYEQLSPSLVPGLTVLLDETAKNWTLPEFSASGTKFERIQPPYAKGYSRFEARKAADGRILLKHSWKSDMAGYSDSGTDYAVLTKDVTPK